MNPIVSQSGHVSYSPTPLLLPAPRIAGLIAATSVTSEPPPKPSPEFTYHNAALTELSAGQLTPFIEAVTTLLDVAVAYAHGDMSDNALRAAQVLFHRQMTGHSPDRPLNPVAYRAERDADLLDWWVGANKRLVASEETSRQRIAEFQRKQAARREQAGETNTPNGTNSEVAP